MALPPIALPWLTPQRGLGNTVPTRQAAERGDKIERHLLPARELFLPIHLF